MGFRAKALSSRAESCLCDDPFPAYRMNGNCWSPAHWTSLRVAGAEAFRVTASGEVEALRVI